MARILAISSYVAYGHVGLGAVHPVLQAMGHDVMAVPSVVLSNHYGYGEVESISVAAAQMAGLLKGLRANGWLDEVDGVISGFMPSVAHVETLVGELERLGDALPDVLYLCDPVLGDDPDGLYVKQDLAASVRDLLLPLADIVTPNRFELAWLTGLDVANAKDALIAAERLGEGVAVVTTSVPASETQLENVLSGWEVDDVIGVPKRLGVPHGTGDLFAALYLGYLLHNYEESDALAKATGVVDEVIEQSLGCEELQLASVLWDAINGSDA